MTIALAPNLCLRPRFCKKGFAMKRILLADDNRHIREYCKSELEEAGYRVLLACDGSEAARFAEGDQLDLAILDVNMPIMDGFEAARRIRAIAPSLPIVFFTAQDDDGSESNRGGPTVARVQKSDDLTELKRAIVRLLAPGQIQLERQDALQFAEAELIASFLAIRVPSECRTIVFRPGKGIFDKTRRKGRNQSFPEQMFEQFPERTHNPPQSEGTVPVFNEDSENGDHPRPGSTLAIQGVPTCG